ncbi:MAG TPA: hypothetical protein VE219_03610 [Candidatus Sulfotelmatobacter sp.]|nr:hypothetical protein [Candidatus Sulfotelmatobacter sp.]
MDDSELDSLAAQVRSFPPLPLDEVADLLMEAQAKPGGAAHATLVEHHLSISLTAAFASGGSPSEIRDLHQEGSLAVFVAISEYASRAGRAAGLHAYVERVVRNHLEGVRRRDEELRRSDEMFVHDAEALEAVMFELRRRLGRAPTTIETAAALEWENERVELMGEMVERARQLHDAEIAQYLDES